MSATLRFGVLLSSHRDPGQSDADVLGRCVAITCQAETLDVDDVWVTEHHFLDHVVAPAPLTLAAYLLGVTSRIHVGTAVTLLPLHSPVHIAEQAALLDHVSGARFALGVGRGQPLVEYEVIGGGIERWRDGMADALDQMLAAFDGKVDGGASLSVVPRPTTPGGPPVYVATNSDTTTRIAAARGLPMFMHFDKPPDVKARMVARYRELAGDGGASADHAFALYAHVTESAGEARELMRERAATMVRGLDRDRLLLPSAAQPPLAGAELAAAIDQVTERLLAMHPVGDVETCVDRFVANIEGSGCTRVLCSVEPHGRAASAAHNLERLAREVFPEVRARLAASGERDVA